MTSYWWVVAVIVVYSIQAFLSKRNNGDTATFTTALLLYLSGIIPIWTIVSRYSKNLVFDGLLFDSLLMLSFTGTMFLLGAAQHFTTHQIIGVVMVVVGLIAIKV